MTLVQSLKFLPAASFLIAPILGHSQTIVAVDSPFVNGTTVVIAGSHHQRSAFHNFFWGKHYRKEWITPVRVKNLLLDTASGGLTPVKESGSRQSRGLRLKNPAGKEYVLRSIDKDFGSGLGEGFKGTFIARIAKDQASSGHPYAATTVAAMIRPTGIFHTNPQIVFLPRQEPLKDYNSEYGNQLYLYEERPDENQEDAPSFGNSKNVVGTEKLLEKVAEDNDDRVDQKAFAKARLFDMFIGDWGRHADQWRWAQFKTDSGTLYKPVPRDRDQAYTIFDGFWPWVATHLAGPGSFLEDFDGSINNVIRFNKPGRPLDRKFLNELSKEDWIAIATELQVSLSDSLIERSILEMPPEIFQISGKKIIAALRSRRDGLKRYAIEYYEYLAQHVILQGSQKRELIDVQHIDRNQTNISIFKLSKEGSPEKTPYYSRTFDENETSSVYVYSLEGSDRIRVTGHGRIRITFIDPDRSDSFFVEDRRRIQLALGHRYQYDTAGGKKFDFSVRPLLSPQEYEVFDKDPAELFTRIGIKISGIARYTPKPWQKEEYRTEHLMSVNYGFLRGTVVAAYIGRFRRAAGRWNLVLKGRADIPAVENFYGVSNRVFEGTGGNKINNPFYKTVSTRIYGGLGLSRDFGIHHAEINPFYQFVKVSERGNYYVTGNAPDPSVFGGKHFGGIEAGYRFRKVDNEIYPTRGMSFSIGGAYVRNLEEKGRSFLKGVSSVAFYIPLGSHLTLAMRGGGAVLDGNADYYHLNTLGGNENLRGFPRERFFGEKSLYNNNDLRWIFDTHNYLFNGKMGILAFFDNGRVWKSGELSNSWHAGYGGGLIVIPFNKVALTGTYGKSRETTHILLQAQLFF